MSHTFQSLKGMTDILPDEIPFWQELEGHVRVIFQNYGYGEIRTPLLESTALFTRGVGEDTQIVQKEMYTFTDKSGDSVTLRPEGTASAVRAYIQNSLAAQDDITKLYYMGPMFRHERPQKGRLRQFHQIGCELLGTESALADAEQILMMNQLTQAVGIQNYAISLNSLGLRAEREKYLAALVQYLSRYKNDLDADSQRRLSTNPLRILDTKDEKTLKICANAPVILDHLGSESKAHFAVVQNKLAAAGVAFKVNPHIVRGLDYYERTTFEFISSDLGAQSTFSGGGRYNRLVEELGGKSTPAVGFALGCERMILIMIESRTLGETAKPGAYFVPLDAESLDLCFAQMNFLRAQGVACEMGYDVKSMKSQMRRADKFKFSHTVIVGENERKKNVVVLKDMRKGTQTEIPVDDLLAALTAKAAVGQTSAS